MKVTPEQAIDARILAAGMAHDLHLIFWMHDMVDADDRTIEHRMAAVHTDFAKLAEILGYDIVRAPADQDDSPLATQLGLVPPPEAA